MADNDCLPLRLKRKDINNDFSDFSLSSPATKIRRLDLGILPVMEEDEIKHPSENEEKAIVLYKPLQHHQPHSDDLFIDTVLLSALKNRILHDAAVADTINDDGDEKNNKQQVSVWWHPSQFQSFKEPHAPEITELDGEDVMMEEAAMDVEEASPIHQQQQQLTGGLHQWQQQQGHHCLIPQLPQTNSTPIPWYL